MTWSPADLALLKSYLPPALVRALRQPEPAPAAILEGCELLGAALKAISPFVPAPVLDLHLARPERGRTTGIYLTGTLLRADIAGFTTLSSQLAAAGPEGSEELSALLNQIFERLLTAIYSSGGGVVQFSGAGLTAFFDAARLGPRHASFAATAALAVREQVDELPAITTSRGSFAIQLELALHSGRLFASEVGDQSHTELLTTGSALNRLMVAQESSTPGQVLVTEETLSALEQAEVEQKLTGIYLLKRMPPALGAPPALPAWRPEQPGMALIVALLQRIRALQPFMPHGMPGRLAQRAESGEFRPVTVLYASFYSFSKLLAILELQALLQGDTSIVGQVLNTYYQAIQEAVHRYGGSINKLDMSSSGNRLLALFGAPVAHEDDPSRAVQSALALRTALAGADNDVLALLREWSEQHSDQRALLHVAAGAVHPRSGIAGGAAFAGLLGNADRHEYSVIGEPVNLAAALLSSAGDDQILLTSRVQRVVRPLVECEALPSARPKGFSQPVPIFRLLRRRPSSGGAQRAEPLVGRRAELAKLVKCAGMALGPAERAGALVSLVGEAGIGKSRLADEFLYELEMVTPGLTLVRDSCRSYELTVPYAVISRLLREMLGLDLYAERSAEAERITRQLDQLVPEWSRFAPLLAPLLSLPLPETPLTQALNAEQRRERLHDLLIMLFQALARRQPLVVVVDDLHWADASSLAVITRLASELAGLPLLLLLLYRPSAELAEPWHEQEHGVQIKLAELSPSDSEALLRLLLDGEPPEELRPLVSQAQGLPFYLEEMVRYMIESKVLKREKGGAWVATSPIGSSVPTRVEQLIMARLDRLDQEARTLAQISAVIGQRFTGRLLVAVSPQLDQLSKRLQELERAAIIVPEEQSGQPAFRFKHALIRDVIYASLLFARRRELHGRVAAAIEHVHLGELDDYRVLLAQQYLQAEQSERAFPHLALAAQQAQARYAHSEAIALYEQALAIAPPGLQSASLYENLGDIQALIGKYELARSHYERLLILEGSDLSPEHRLRQAALQRKIGSVYEQQGDPQEALIWLERARASLEGSRASGAAVEHARVLSDMGWANFRRSSFEQADHYLRQALNLISTLEQPLEHSSILNRLGGVTAARGDLLTSRHYVEQSLAIGERSGDLMGQANALNNLGNLLADQGMQIESINFSLQAMSIYERVGSRRAQAITAINVGVALCDYGDYPQARRYLNQALQQAKDLHDPYLIMFSEFNLTRVLLSLDEPDAAADAALQALVHARSLNHLPAQLEMTIALGEIALRSTNLVEALMYQQQALALVSGEESESQARYQRFEAQICAAQGDNQRALELLAGSETLFQRLQLSFEAEQTRLLSASLSPQQERGGAGELWV